MFTRAAAIALALATAGCVHPAVHNEALFRALDFHRLDQAETDYANARAALSAVASRLSHKRLDPDTPSPAEIAAALDLRAHVALQGLRAAYDRRDAVRFEYEAGELRLVSAQIYTLAQGA